MIRFKDKIFEQYSICPATGEIFNAKTGEVQKTQVRKNRPVFNSMPVHQIMANTFYGYNPGLVVHHKDENKLNNALSNLVYLTNEEHTSLHKKGKKREPFSEEWKAKMSAAHKGKKFSEEHKAKMRSAQLRRWSNRKIL